MTQDRRLRILGLVVLLVFGVAWLRAGMLTTVSANGLRAKLDEGRVPQTIAAPRGTITDRSGYVLAISEQSADIFASPKEIKDPTKVAAQLAPILGRSTTTLYDKLTADSGFEYLARLASPAQVKKIRALAIPGIGLTPKTRRQYPQDTVASQLVGMTGVDGTGLSGIELSLDKALTGEDGKRLLIRGRGGADAKVVYVKDEKTTQPGESVKLSIDLRIQAEAEKQIAAAATKFQAKSATAIVMQPSTGKLLAVASWPKVDANDASEAPAAARAVAATSFNYEPGSTFKPFTVAGALEEHEITPDTTFDIPNQYQVADRVIKDAEDHGAETLTTGQILSQSSNIGTVKIAQRLGAKRFDEWIRKFGFGQTTGVEIAGEQRGRLLDVGDYSGSSIGNLPIGQGELVTPMQLISGYSTFANNGVREQPTILDSVNGKDVERAPGKRIVTANTAKQMRDMLEKTSEVGGTAASVAISGYTLASKTGTAQIFDTKLGEYSHTMYNSSVFGMAPADHPKIVVAVLVNDPNSSIGYYGASVAGPAFKQITQSTLNYLGVRPN
ncbi:MAG: penicillin-binding protein 2 [Solirubrobacteraceae bacterium]|nr:penicillin-binding protein 2 [Patulibacter sp.]